MQAMRCRSVPSAPQTQCQLGSSSTHVHAVRRHIVPNATLSRSDAKIPWYEQQKELFVELQSRQELEGLAKSSSTPFVAVDYFAGWCASCKSSYPRLCKIAANPALRQSFTFAKANIELPEIKAMLKEENIMGIPYMLVYDKQAQRVLAFGASFKKMDQVRKNLEAVAAHPGEELVLDPSGYAILPSADQQALQN